MKKYYRVIKENFLWNLWAIICKEDWEQWYLPISDFMKKSEGDNSEYISAWIIEDKVNSEYFERVYTDDVLWKIFKTKDKMKEIYEKMFK